MYMCIFSHTFYCCYKPLPLCWAFAVLWSFPFFSLSLSFKFPLLILKPIIIFSTFIPLFAFPTVLFPLQLVFFLIEGKLHYRIFLFSVKPQHESATDIHISPPFSTCLPSPSPYHPSRLILSPCLNH